MNARRYFLSNPRCCVGLLSAAFSLALVSCDQRETAPTSAADGRISVSARFQEGAKVPAAAFLEAKLWQVGGTDTQRVDVPYKSGQVLTLGRVAVGAPFKVSLAGYDTASNSAGQVKILRWWAGGNGTGTSDSATQTVLLGVPVADTSLSSVVPTSLFVGAKLPLDSVTLWYTTDGTDPRVPGNHPLQATGWLFIDQPGPVWAATLRAADSATGAPELWSSLGKWNFTLFDATSIPWNSSISYDSITDARDGQVYKTVVIGGRTWMAQNLNYHRSTGATDAVGVCNGDSAAYCDIYGRMYTWSEAMGVNDSFQSVPLNAPSQHRGICPSGWHVPSDSEWNALIASAGGGITATMKLKSASGWTGRDKGTDAFGLRILPAGWNSGGYANDVGGSTIFWTASEDSVTYASNSMAWRRDFVANTDTIAAVSDAKDQYLSLRCVQDVATP
jgi:uncharacterized protein (TIGR02145 family)